MNAFSARLPLAAALAAVCLFAPACNKEKAPATGGAKATTSADMPPDTVLATVGSDKITAGQLDKDLGAQLQQLQDQYDKQKFDMRRQKLDAMVLEKLVKAEAAKKGQTEEQFIKAEVDDKITPPSDEQIKKTYDENAGRLPPGSSLEQFKPQIVEFLSRGQKQEKFKELRDRLMKENHVAIKLTEPRKQVEAKGPTRGPGDAKVTIVEFSDFECPFCARAHDTVEEVMKAYAGKVKLVYRQYPLPFHPHAQKASEAALCANEQGKFWEYHDQLFTNQKALEPEKLKEYAKSVGLDEGKFSQCLESGKFASQVKADADAGSAVGVSGTPAFFINGVMLSGAQPLDEFKRVIDQELGS